MNSLKCPVCIDERRKVVCNWCETKDDSWSGLKGFELVRICGPMIEKVYKLAIDGRRILDRPCARWLDELKNTCSAR